MQSVTIARKALKKSFLGILFLTFFTVCSYNQTFATGFWNFRSARPASPRPQITPPSDSLDTDSYYSAPEDFEVSIASKIEELKLSSLEKMEAVKSFSLRKLDEKKILADQEVAIEMEKARILQKENQWNTAVNRMHTLGVVTPYRSVQLGAALGLAGGLVSTGATAGAMGIPSALAAAPVLISTGTVAGAAAGLSLGAAAMISAPIVGLGGYALNRLRSALTRSPISIQTLKDHAKNPSWVDKLHTSFALSQVIESRLPKATQDKIQEQMNIFSGTLETQATKISQRRRSNEAKLQAYEQLLPDELDQKFKPISHKIADKFCRLADRLRPNKGIKERLSQFFRKSIFGTQTDPTSDRAMTYKAKLDKEAAKIAQDAQILEARIMKGKIQIVDQVRQQEEEKRDKEQLLAARTEARSEYQTEIGNLTRYRDEKLKYATAKEMKALSTVISSGLSLGFTFAGEAFSKPFRASQNPFAKASRELWFNLRIMPEMLILGGALEEMREAKEVTRNTQKEFAQNKKRVVDIRNRKVQATLVPNRSSRPPSVFIKRGTI